jgi:hypothetical protein
MESGMPGQQMIAQAAETVQRVMGKRALTDEEILVLACEEISRTYTRVEKDYKA